MPAAEQQDARQKLLSELTYVVEIATSLFLLWYYFGLKDRALDWLDDARRWLAKQTAARTEWQRTATEIDELPVFKPIPDEADE